MAVLRFWLAGLCLVLFAGGTLALPRARIEAFDVERIAALQPGARLTFTVFGSAGAQVQLEIEGGRQILPLRETDAGIYEGVYVIDAQDRIAANSRVLATLRGVDNSLVRATLEEPLLLEAAQAVAAAPPSPPSPPVAGPNWTQRRAEPVDAARALPPPIEAQRNAPLASAPTWPPTSPPPSPPIESRRAVPPVASATPDTSVFPPGCRQCAVVESIRGVEQLPPRPPRTVAGNVLGALFGEGVAEHVDRHFDRVNTAVDRAVTGRGQTPLPQTRYEVLLRLPNGQRLTRLYNAAPPFQPGDILVLPESAGSRAGPGAAGRAADRLAQGG